MSRARIGSFSQPTLTFGQPLSVVQPPDNNFEVAANSPNQQAPSAEQDYQKAIEGSLANEIAGLYESLREAQELNK